MVAAPAELETVLPFVISIWSESRYVPAATSTVSLFEATLMAASMLVAALEMFVQGACGVRFVALT